MTMNTLRRMFSTRADKVLLGLFVFMTIWIIVLRLLDMQGTVYNYLYNVFLIILPGYGGIIGFIRMKQWGGYKSIIGKSTFFYCLSLFSWSVGTLIWAFYNFFLNIEVPYPSLADLAYFQFYIWLGIGIVNLFIVTSVRTSFEKPIEKVINFCVPISMAIVTYYFIFVELHSGTFGDDPLKVFVDLGYPSGQIAILIIVILASGSTLNYLGQRLKVPLYIIMFGLVANYIADFYFSYATTVGSYYVGTLGDYLYTISLFIMSLGLSNLHPKLLEDKE